MSKPNDRGSVLGILGNLGWPMILGLWATGLFYVLLFKGPLNHPSFHRYFTGHPISYFETGLFFVGLFALLLKAVNISGQFGAIGAIQLEPVPPRGQKLEDAERLIESLQNYPKRQQQSYLGRRLHDALEHIERTQSAAKLDDELKYLSDLDAARQQDSYGLARIVIWATPMLGFLGTVMGITQALGDLDPSQLANDVQNAMKGLLAGLYVAFDTTALALTLSMVLMFIQFIIERFETQVLSAVDIRANEEMIGRFEQLGASHDPHVASMERMGETVVRVVEATVKKQAVLWQQAMTTANERYATLVSNSSEQVQSAVGAALAKSLTLHAQEMAKIEQTSAEQIATRWQQWQTALSESARLLHGQQQEMSRQGELLHRALEATGEVLRLEEALNANLSALAGSKNFEDTVMSLSAAIHLLNTRLLAPDTKHVDLGKSSTQGRAA